MKIQKRPTTVAAYIASSPPAARPLLKQLRKVIKAAVPEADEKISYGIPYYGHKGRLAYFALSHNHIGLYIPPPVIKDHKRDLQGYSTSPSTVRFPLGRKLPLALIRKLVKARLRKNLRQRKQ